jgi:hypothetical protein
MEIGILYRKAQGAIVDSVRCLIEVGARLTEKKNSLPHGAWLPWLDEYVDALGFTESTAQRLMKAAANPALTRDLTEADALKISRLIWGNAPRALPKPNTTPASHLTVDDVDAADDPEASAAVMKARHAAAEVDDDESGPGDSDEVCWRRGLMLRAAEAIKGAVFEDWSHYKVDPQLVSVALRAAEAWSQVATYLQKLQRRV